MISNRFAALLLLTLLFSWLSFGSAQAVDQINIAVVGPMSGPSAQKGHAMQQGAQLFIDQVNSQGGINGKQILLQVLDDQNKTELAAQRAREIAESNALIVLGHRSSAASIEGGKVYQQVGIPAITATATATGVTADNEWYFRVIFDNPQEARFIANYVKHVLGQERAAIIHDINAYGMTLATPFVTALGQNGVQLSYQGSLSRKSPSIDQDIEKLVNELAGVEDVGVLFLAVHDGEATKLLRQIKPRDLDIPIIAGSSLGKESFSRGFDQFVEERQRPGYYTDGMLASSHLIFDSAGEQAQVFRRTYEERYQEVAEASSAGYYDAAMVAVQALRNVDLGQEHQKIRDSLKDYLSSMNSAERGVDGNAGRIYFDESGNAVKPVPMGTYQRQRLISAPVQFNRINFLPGDKPDLAAIKIGDDGYWKKSNVVNVGVKIHGIDAVDLESLTSRLIFDVWFRYVGDIKPETILFHNSGLSIDSFEVLDTYTEGDIHYIKYRVDGEFKIDYSISDFGFGEHLLGFQFRHRSSPRKELIYVVDQLGMGLDNKPLTNSIKDERVLSPGTGWVVSEATVFTDSQETNSMGDPRYFGVSESDLTFSRFNLMIRVKENRVTVQDLFSIEMGYNIAAVSLFVLIVLLALRKSRAVRGRRLLVWIGLVTSVTLFLSSIQIVAVDSARTGVDEHVVELIVMLFDLAWWMSGAILTNLGIEWFILQPLERASNHLIPGLIRRTIAFIIYLLTFFGIYAFVFDQKLTSILATSGVLAMIVGMALQLNLANVFSGIAMNLEAKVRLNDWVMIHSRTQREEEGLVGRVVDIGWRTTQLVTTGGNLVTVPNNEFSQKTITNFMLPAEKSRLELEFTVAFEHGAKVVSEAIVEAMQELEGKLKGPLETFKYSVRPTLVSRDGIVIQVRYWVVPRYISPAKTRGLIIDAVTGKLEDRQITLAYHSFRTVPYEA